MRMVRRGTVLMLILCLLATAVTAGAETYVAQNGQIPDTTLYRGSWKDAYLQILNSHSGAIHRYQNRTIDFIYNGRNYSVPCMPVGLEDLNGDGIQELLFLEEASGGTRGDLYIYSSNGNTTQCVLYVPGITRLDYDDMLGFSIYMSSDSGGTLVIEHYEYETPWVLQFFISNSGRYGLLSYQTMQGDYSGEGNDLYYRSGIQISADAYYAGVNAIRDRKTREISDYFRTDYNSYGFDITWESAVYSLGGQSEWDRGPAEETGYGEVYGLTIQMIATRKGPGTNYAEGGTYNVKGQYLKVLAKAYDKRNGIWWVKCVIPYHGENRVLWTGYKRFDKNTLSLDDLPEEFW